MFISYRRDDGPHAAGRFYDFLSMTFGPKQVFMDVETLGAAEDFSERIAKVIEGARVILVLMGKNWNAWGADGRPRMHSDKDYVRIELELALKERRRRLESGGEALDIIPVVLDRTVDLSQSDLPISVSELKTLNARFVFGEKSFAEQMEPIARHIESATGPIGPSRSFDSQRYSAKLVQHLSAQRAPVKFAVSIGSGDFCASFLSRYLSERVSAGQAHGMASILVRHLSDGLCEKLSKAGVIDRAFKAKMRTNIQAIRSIGKTVAVDVRPWKAFPPFHGYLVGRLLMIAPWQMSDQGRLHVNTNLNWYPEIRYAAEIDMRQAQFDGG